MKRIILSTILLASAMIFTLALGCDGGDDKDKEPGVDTVVPADTATPDDTVAVDDGVPGETMDFVGMVEGFGMDGQLVSNVTVELYNNETGKGMGTTQVSDDDGYVTFKDLEKGKLYGFKCTLDNYKDTFVWNIEVGAIAEETLWILPNTVYQMALGLAGLTQQADKSVVAGAVYWLEGSEEIGIGCATVTSEPPTDDVRYMAEGNGLPTTLENQPNTGCPDTEGNGRYVVGNLPAGQVTMTATDASGAVVGSTTLWSIAGTVSVSNIYPNEDVTEQPAAPCCN
jgi:hypothetical protein